MSNFEIKNRVLNRFNNGELVDVMRRWRRQLHQHPETAYEEVLTAELVSTILTEHGIEHHKNIAETGIVAVLKNGTSDRAVGLRADMDALDLEEENQFDHRSKVQGKMHACGHDGHTSMLLGAACYLSETKNFDGTIYLIFQPAEEVEGGAQRMIEEGLFDRFPMDAVFGMHNMPKHEVGTFAICSGPMMAAFGIFECTIKGIGMHSSMPHLAIDPIEIGAELLKLWKAILYETVDPFEKAVISITQFNSGTTQNISPELAVLRGSTRCFSSDVAAQIELRMREIAESHCKSKGASCQLEYRQAYPALINEQKSTEFAANVAESIVGPASVDRHLKPLFSSEDFACMLHETDGAYILIGNGVESSGGCMIHNPNYDFNDEILELGATYWIKLAESYLLGSGTSGESL